MKKEFPILWAKVSTFIATPVIIAATLLYMDKFIRSPASEIYGFGLSAIGITAALSAICLSAAIPPENDMTQRVFRYAGEKFLHSCLLLIQILFIAFARDNIVVLEWMADHNNLKRATEWFANTAGVFVTSTAAFSWYWAFQELNTRLWENWRQRIDDINSS